MVATMVFQKRENQKFKKEKNKKQSNILTEKFGSFKFYL